MAWPNAADLKQPSNIRIVVEVDGEVQGDFNLSNVLAQELMSGGFVNMRLGNYDPQLQHFMHCNIRAVP